MKFTVTPNAQAPALCTHFQLDVEKLYIATYREVEETRVGLNGQVAGESVHPAWTGVQLEQVAGYGLYWDRVRTTPGWSDHGVWIGNATTERWHNVVAETLLGKRDVIDYVARLREAQPGAGIYVLVPWANSTPEELIVHVGHQHPTLPHLFNGEPLKARRLSYEATERIFFPQLRITGPLQVAPNETLTVTISAVDHLGRPLPDAQATVYLEELSGYAAHKRVNLVNGQAQCRLQALGLLEGETLRVKFGWKHYSGAAEYRAEVVK